MSGVTSFEQIEQDAYSPLTQQAAALIVRDLYEADGPPHDYSASVIWKRIGQMENIGSHYVVQEEGTVLGVIAVRKCIDATTMRIVELVTDRFARHQGYGRKLIGGIAQIADGEGCTKIRLNASPKAIGFYMRLGFEHIKDCSITALEAEVGVLHETCHEEITVTAVNDI